MSRFLIAFSCLVLFTSFAVAQNEPRFDIFAGYSLERVAICGHVNGGCGVESGDLSPQQVYNGWAAAPTYHFNRSVEFTADFSGHYKSIGGTVGTASEHIARYGYMFGPTLPLFPGKETNSTVFIHLLFGAVHQSVSFAGVASGSFSSTQFGMRPGGGWDINVSRHFKVRVAQVEYEYIRVPLSSVANGSSFTNGFRYSAGIVLR